MSSDDINSRAVDPLVIPAWVPRSVAIVAQIYFSIVRGNEDSWVLSTLISNPTMKTVWDILRRRSTRDVAKYFHPAKSTLVGLEVQYRLAVFRELEKRTGEKPTEIVCLIDAAKELSVEIGSDQDLALAKIFEVAYQRATFDPLLLNLTPDDKKEASELHRMSDACYGLYHDFKNLKKHAQLIDNDLRQSLFHASMELRIAAHDLLSRYPFARSKNDDDFLRGYVISLSHAMDGILGQRMDGLVARIANCVIPSASENRRSVENICKKPTSRHPPNSVPF